MKKFLQRIAYKFARRMFVRNFNRFCVEQKKRALIYNKTEEFLLQGFLQDFSHTNNWESFEMAKVLNELGFVVDVIDRTATLDDVEKIEDKYNLFIGLGAGDSGQYFADIAARVPHAIKVLYAMGPEPDLSNSITKARHDYFRARHPEFPVKDRRLILNVDTERLYKVVDSIITIGNEFSYGSYLNLGKDVHKIYLSSYSKLFLDESEMEKKNKSAFLYFGGNGNITKGLDLVLEAFASRPDLTLYIGAPSSEEDFNAFADPIIAKHSNIHRLGFIDVTSKKYRNLTAKCGYVIMPSSSEGCATSVTTCMRRGLIPIVTVESGIENAETFGFITDGTVEGVIQTLKIASSISEEEFLKRVKMTYKQSDLYTQKNFSKSLKFAIENILSIHHAK